METLIDGINKLVEKEGKETADNILAGMLLIHKDYFKLKKAIEDYINEE